MPWRDIMVARVAELVREANRGRWPTTVWQWRRAARRFGCRVRTMPRSVCPDPLLRRGVIWIPVPADRQQLHRFLAHELAEAVMRWEGEPPCCHPAGDGWDRHRIAVRVEVSRSEPRTESAQ